MSILPNKMVTYQDLKDMILTGDFGEKEFFSASPQCANKDEVSRVLIFDVTPEFNTLTSNQLVPRRTLDSSSVNPTSFTMAISPTTNSCTYLITWTQSFGRGTIVPLITKYELSIEGLFSGQFTTRTEEYKVNEIGMGDPNFGVTGVLYRMIRNGREYTFKMRSYDSNGAVSDWTTPVLQIAELDSPFFTNGYYAWLEYGLKISNYGDGIVSANITTDGWHIYFIIDRGSINAAIYAYRLEVPGKLSSIMIPVDEADIFKDIQATTGTNVFGGVLSENGEHAFLTAKQRTVSEMHNTAGWSSGMDFQRRSEVYFSEIITAITDIQVTPGGYYIYLSDVESTKILEIALQDAWQLKEETSPGIWVDRWSYKEPIDIGEGPFVGNGYTAKGISSFTILNGGKQIRMQVLYQENIPDHSRIFTSIVLLNTNYYYLFRESDNENVVITMEWQDPCTHFQYNVIYPSNAFEYKKGYSKSFYNPLASAIVRDYLGEVIFEDDGTEHILRLNEPV